MGSKRRSDHIGIIDEKQLSKEMILTMILLMGGTPIILYGEEIALDQVRNKNNNFPLLFLIIYI